MPERIVVIMNPASSRGSTEKRVDQVHSLLKSEHMDFEVVQTTAKGCAIAEGRHVPGSGAFLAAEAVRNGATTVVAAGGDGTVGEVVNGLVGSDIPLAVLPMGTGNDFARTIGLGTSLELAARTLAKGKPQAIDLGKGPGGYFVNIAGCGFDAEVAHRINHGFRRLRGTSAYLAAVFQTLATMKPVPITLTIDGGVHHEKVMLCAVANARTYGGGMMIAPNAELHDGLFDVVIVGDVGKVEFLRAFPQVFKGTHTNHPKVKIRRASHVRIESEHAMPVLADGEELGLVPVEFEVVPGAARVMMPS